MSNLVRWNTVHNNSEEELSNLIPKTHCYTQNYPWMGRKLKQSRTFRKQYWSKKAPSFGTGRTNRQFLLPQQPIRSDRRAITGLGTLRSNVSNIVKNVFHISHTGREDHISYNHKNMLPELHISIAYRQNVVHRGFLRQIDCLKNISCTCQDLQTIRKLDLEAHKT